MKQGDIVGKRYLTDFKGILVEPIKHEEDELKRWKVLWFKHPYKQTIEGIVMVDHSTCVELVSERGLCNNALE